MAWCLWWHQDWRSWIQQVETVLVFLLILQGLQSCLHKVWLVFTRLAWSFRPTIEWRRRGLLWYWRQVEWIYKRYQKIGWSKAYQTYAESSCVIYTLAGQPRTFGEDEIPLDMSINEVPDFEVGVPTTLWTNIIKECEEEPYCTWHMTEFARKLCYFDDNYAAILPPTDTRLRKDR